MHTLTGRYSDGWVSFGPRFGSIRLWEKRRVSIIARMRRLARRLLFRDVPTFVILLERDRERSVHVHEDLAPQLPRCEIVPATDFKSSDMDGELARAEIYVDRAKYRNMTPSKTACSVSHIRVWRKIVERKLPAAIVLEDDVAVGPEFRSFVGRLRRELPADFDLVHLFVAVNRDVWSERAAAVDTPYVDFVPKWGRSAYMVSAKGARKLLDGFATIRDHGDIQITGMARSGEISVLSATEEHVTNLGQADANYRGERFPSNIWNPDRTS